MAGALAPSRVSGVAGPQHARRCGRSSSNDGGGRPCLGPRAAAAAAGLDWAVARCGLRRHVIWLSIGGGVEGLVDCLAAPMADLFWLV